MLDCLTPVLPSPAPKITSCPSDWIIDAAYSPCHLSGVSSSYSFSCQVNFARQLRYQIVIRLMGVHYARQLEGCAPFVFSHSAGLVG